MDAKEAVVAWINASVPSNPVAAFDSLADMVHFSACLRTAASYAFADTDLIEKTDNWIIREGNIKTLLEAMTRFGKVYLKGPAEFDAGKAIGVQTASVAKGESPSQLLDLAEYVVAMCVLSGNPSVMGTLRGLTKDHQGTLSGMTKRVMTLQGFKKLSGVAPSSAGGQPSAPTSPPPAGSASSGGAAAGGVRQFEEVRASDDPTLLRSQIGVLKSELRDKSTALQLAESRAEMADQQLQQVQSRYRVLLEESESRGPNAREVELHQQMSKKEAAVEQLNQMCTELSAENHKLKGVIEEGEDKTAAVRKQLEEANKKLKAAADEKADAINRLVLAQDKAEVSARRRDELERELQEVSDKLREQQQQITAGVATKGLNTSALSNKGTEDATALIEELRAKLAAKEREVSMLRAAGGEAELMGRSHNGSLPSNPNSSGEEVSNSSITAFGGGTALTTPASVEEIQERDATIGTLRSELEAVQKQLQHANDRLADQSQSHRVAQENYNLKLKMAEEAAVTAAAAAAASSSASNSGATAEALQQALSRCEEALNENEGLKRHLAAATDTAQRKGDAQGAAEMKARLEERDRIMRAEHTAITAAVYQCGRRNLTLLQKGLLGGAAVPAAYRDESFAALFTDPARVGSLQRQQAARAAAAAGGSHSGSSGAGRGLRSVFEDDGTSDTFLSNLRVQNIWGSFMGGGAPIPSNTGSAQQGSKRK